MKYGYYPGCSLERNAIAYHQSTMAVARHLGMELNEVEDWNCCGATEYISVNRMAAYALIGRNLALAAQQGGTANEHAPANGNGTAVEATQLVAPCSACYLNLSKVDYYLGDSPELADTTNQALAAGGLHYTPGSVRVRHLLDVVVNDVGIEEIAAHVRAPLHHLRLAPYYGCLAVRPGFGGRFDDPEYPTSLDKLLRTLGSTVVDFPLKAHCCGGHMTQISQDTALELIRRILHNAAEYQADAIVTLCPMCQINLDLFQESVNRRFNLHYELPVLYFTQVLGLAMGIEPAELGIGKEIVDAQPALAKIGQAAREQAADKQPRAARPRRGNKSLPMPRMAGEKLL
jgi:heterodisulfide reductase subunit B2